MGIRPGTEIYFKEENGRFILTKNSEDKLSHWFGAIQDKDPDEFLDGIRGRGTYFPELRIYPTTDESS